MDQNISDVKIAFKILTKVDTLAPILFLNRTQFAEKRTLFHQAGNWEKKLYERLKSILKCTVFLTIKKVNFVWNRVTGSR